MKFSVLLPTKNRLEYLKFAIDSVLKQNYQNWEIIVSDNFSEQDIKGYVDSLKDSRIKYYRTSSPLPVTDNWNNALDKCTGDYFIMLGDDDSLLNGYFDQQLSLINQFKKPDVIYSKAYQYAYPNVMPNIPKGILYNWGNASFLEKKSDPFILNKIEAIALAKQSLDFTIMFNYNMQFALISRKMIDELKKKGPFFQSPYPDYYAMTSLFLQADRIVATPKPMVVVGITPKSFGFFYFNSKEGEGVEFLDNIQLKDNYLGIKKYILPGTYMNTSWLLAMESVFQNFGKEHQLKVSYYKYRFLQMMTHFKNFVCNDISYKQYQDLNKHLLWWEKLIYTKPIYWIAKYLKLKKNGDAIAKKWTLYFSHPTFTITHVNGNFNTIADVFDSIK